MGVGGEGKRRKKAFIEAEWKIRGLEKLSCLRKPRSQTAADAGTMDYGNYLG